MHQVGSRGVLYVWVPQMVLNLIFSYNVQLVLVSIPHAFPRSFCF